MIAIAVTGGIGSGKSTVSAVLREHGAVVADSDRLAREVVAPGSPGLLAVSRVFGPTILTAEGALDRAALAAVVFADPSARQRLEGITHPLVRGRFDEIRRAAQIILSSAASRVPMAITPPEYPTGPPTPLRRSAARARGCRASRRLWSRRRSWDRCVAGGRRRSSG